MLKTLCYIMGKAMQRHGEGATVNGFKIRKYLGGAIVALAFVAAALVTALFIELPVLSNLARSGQGFLGL